IKAAWQPYHQSDGLPFLQQRFQPCPVWLSILGGQSRQRSGAAGDGFADGDADTAHAEVESEISAGIDHVLPMRAPLWLKARSCPHPAAMRPLASAGRTAARTEPRCW